MKYTELEIAGMLQDNNDTIYKLKEEIKRLKEEIKERDERYKKSHGVNYISFK